MNPRSGSCGGIPAKVESSHYRTSPLIPCFPPAASREVVASLIDEYKACESVNYVNWGIGQGEASDGVGSSKGVEEGKSY